MTTIDANTNVTPHALEAARQSPRLARLAEALAAGFTQPGDQVAGITVTGVDMFGPNPGVIKVSADIVALKRDAAGQNVPVKVPGVAVITGDSVSILTILVCEGREYAALVVQPRVPVGARAYVEIPAGRLDKAKEDVLGIAVGEINGELGIKMMKSDLIDLRQAALGIDGAVHLSPGILDEAQTAYLYRKEVTRDELEDIQDRCTGELDEGEMITVKVVPLEQMLEHAPHDGKSERAFLLYERAKTRGTI